MKSFFPIIIALTAITSCQSQNKDFRKQVIFEMAVTLEKSHLDGSHHKKYKKEHQ